jgi:hypothetical protein
MQWMTAGRGVVHAEMPGGEDVQRGLNLWLNLSSKDKMYVEKNKIEFFQLGFSCSEQEK